MPYQKSLPVLFGSQSYQARSKSLSSQDLINLYAEKAPSEGKAPIALYRTPGQTLFIDAAQRITEGAVVRITEDGEVREIEYENAFAIYGLHVMDGLLFVIAEGSVYTVSETKILTLIGSIGSNTNFVQTEDNGSQLVILKDTGEAYVATVSSVEKITNPGYRLSRSVTFQDGYHIFSVINSDEFFISGLNDALTYDPLDFDPVDGRPGDIVRSFSDHRELWHFKTNSIEIYYNSGAADFPFARIQGAFIERGCAATLSVAKEDNTIYWLGDDLIVYQATQYEPVRVSTHAIEKAIEGLDSVSNAISYIYTQEGHKFYVLSFPGTNLTVVYDITTDTWHRRETFEQRIWNAQVYAFAYNKHLVGGPSSPVVFELDLDAPTDGGKTISCTVVSPTIFYNGDRIIFDRLRVDIDAGLAPSTGQGAEPLATLYWSDDGGQTYSNGRTVSMGKIGEYKQRLVWRNLGQSRQRIFKLVVTDPTRFNILQAYVDVRIGRA